MVLNFFREMQSNRILSWFVTSYWFSSGAPNHLTAVNNITLELKSHVPYNHLLFATSWKGTILQKNDVFGFASKLYASENLDLLKRIRKQLTKQILPHVGVSYWPQCTIVIVQWPSSSATSEKPLSWCFFVMFEDWHENCTWSSPFCTLGRNFPARCKCHSVDCVFPRWPVAP